jgi:methylamine utilization protein MauE
MEYVRAGCAALFAVVFAVSAWSKLRDFRGFAHSVPDLAPVPARWVTPVSVTVVAAESATAVLVLIPATATLGFALALALMLAFIAGIAHALRRGRRTSCRCFGASDTPVGPRHIARNFALAVVAVLGALAPGHAIPFAGFALAGLTGIVLAVFVVAMDDIAVIVVRSS